MNSIYLDYNASTPVDPEVRAEMENCLTVSPGNPSSLHAAGQAPRRIIDKARRRVAALIGAQPEEILFCSGGTEANNLAILGSVAAAELERPRIATTAIEHQSVLNPCRHLEQKGAAVTFLPVDGECLLDPATAAEAIGADTMLVSVMLANNDTGAIQPLAAVSALTRNGRTLLHTDAAQAVGKIAVDVNALGVDLLSLSGHKLHGPHGAGALYVRKGTKLSPLVFGGHQERGLRPGTENVAAIVGLGKACELAASRLNADAVRLEGLRASFEAAIRERVPGAIINGGGAPRLPNTSNINFDGLDGEALVINLDLLGVAVSTGAACSTAAREPNHVLLAMGRSPDEARSSVRFSLGRETTAEEMARAVELVCRAVELCKRGH